ncbi:MAG: tetratricopeptide repeat protein [Gammaproteobacteria bacterium]|nr:tetratricopeptide repeat protein [Gammaproteobacteria bacterium]
MLAVLCCIFSRVSWALEDNEEKVKSLTAYTMGVVYDLQGYSEKAIKEFRKSAEYDDNYAIHLRLGADYARLGELPQAIDELQLVLDQNPNNVQARYLLALIYSTQKEFGKAADQYEAILQSFSKAEPENIEIYGYLAQLYYARKEYDKAIKQFQIILSLNNQDSDVMFLLGTLYLETGERDKAIEFFSRAIKVNSKHDIALNSLGYVYAEEESNLEEAQALIERALKVDPGNGAYLDSLGWVYYKQGRYEEALKYLQEAGSHLKDPVIYEHLGDVYLKLQQEEEAKKYWSLSLELLSNQGHILEKLKSLDPL